MLACTWTKLCCDVTSIFWNTGWTVFLHSQAVYPVLPSRVGYAPVSLGLCFWCPALWRLCLRLYSSSDVMYDVVEVRSYKWGHGDEVIGMMSWLYDVVGQWCHPVYWRLCFLATWAFIRYVFWEMMLGLWCHLYYNLGFVFCGEIYRMWGVSTCTGLRLDSVRMGNQHGLVY